MKNACRRVFSLFLMLLLINASHGAPAKADSVRYEISNAESYGAYIYDDAFECIGILLNGVKVTLAENADEGEFVGIHLPSDKSTAPFFAWIQRGKIAEAQRDAEHEFLTNTVRSDNCKLYSLPSEQSEALADFCFKERITVLGRCGAWYYAYAQNHFGYVRMDRMLIFSTTSDYRNYTDDMMGYTELYFVASDPTGHEQVSSDTALEIARNALSEQFKLSSADIDQFDLELSLNVSHGIGSMWYFAFSTESKLAYAVQINTRTGEIFECIDAHAVESF